MRLLLPLALLLVTLAGVPAQAGQFELIPPLRGRVLQGYEEVGRFEAGHRGVDLAGRAGEEVVAAAPGRVHFAGDVAGRGTVSIDHGNGWRTTYQPVSPSVVEGDVLAAGDGIGTLAPGHCLEACLHWGLTDGVAYADPLAYLELPPVRLLPHGAEPPSPPELAAASVPVAGELPVEGRLSSPFGMRRHPVTGRFKLHDGTDIAAACGTPVRAPNPGTVLSADFHLAYGYRVTIDHGGGVRMAYTHLPGLSVRPGQRVAAGEQIGVVGNTGLSTGCHLHWMAWRDGGLVDPLSLVTRGGGRP